MDLLQALVNGQSSDENTRKHAEEFIQNASKINFPAFLHGLATELSKESNPEPTRQLAGIVLKNSLNSKNEEINAGLSSQWLAIDEAQRSVIKDILLQGLSSPAHLARHTCAMDVACIGLIEIPNNQWETLVPTLIENIKSTNDFLKEATLEALGFICQEIDPSIMTKYSNQVLTVITTGMKDPNAKVQLAGTRAMGHALEFVKSNFEIKEQRDYILKVIFDNANSQDSNVKQVAFECLVKIVTLYYEFILTYMIDLYNLTVSVIEKDPNEGVVLQAIEFWTSLAEEEQLLYDELDRKQLIIPQALTQLIPVMLKTLTKQEEIDDGWGVTQAGTTCISAMAEVSGDDILPHVYPFIQNNITSPEWRLREAACIALGSILQGPTNFNELPNLIPHLVNMLKDPNEMVKDTASWTIGRICNHQISAIPNYLEVLIKALIEATADPVSKIAAHACWAIHNICQAFEEGPIGPISSLAPAFNPLAQCLLNAAHRPKPDEDDRKLKTNAYEALNSLISFSGAPVEPIIEILKLTLNDFEQSLKLSTNNPNLNTETYDNVSNLQALLCSTLLAVSVTIKEAIEPFAEFMMTCLIQVFSNQSAIIYEEALLAIGSIIHALDVKFKPFVPKTLEILSKCLVIVEMGSVTSIAVAIVGDIARIMGKEFTPYCNEIVQLVLSVLKNPKSSMSSKPNALSCLGDIALSIGAGFGQFLQIVMPILNQASFIPVYDEEFLNELRCALFETYTSIIHGLKSDEQSAQIQPYMGDILRFVGHVYEDKDRYDTVTVAAIGLLGDIAQALGDPIRPALEHEVVKGFIKEGYEKNFEIAQWTQRYIFGNKQI
ncbi:hypothetical protein CYY_002462 [Polysphondylium violaceum]|uniref:Importin N-terminal domain-containing protein n=1 Tax=Polysphondylium violaceum TaxID=133409 RepID=A0A8J4PYD4_9MYCE|nr:hypothetical protein CYY_002462 [Polysphondylium violaceum]